MNQSEKLADIYLRSLDMGAVVFEPDGNVPPDFLVAGRVAVEVRRLNQNFENAANTSEGLEEASIPLSQRMQRFLREFAPSSGECWYVGYGFRRPLEAWQVLRPLLSKALTDFSSMPVRQRTKLHLTPHFDIDFFPADKDFGSFFILGAYSDNHSGGWTLYELAKSLRLCIAEKESKVATYRARYPEWWLVLDDRIDHALDERSRVQFVAHVRPTISHSFDRVILLDPRGQRSAFEV